MKKIFILLSFVFAIAINAQTDNKVAKTTTETSNPNNKTVNTEKSTVAWKAEKVGGSHEGTINVKEGNLTFDEEGSLNGGKFTIDMSSIACTDLEGEWSEKLVSHLKSPDFFGVDEFPYAILVINKVVPKGTPNDYKVSADITIKETTKAITFYVNATEREGTADLTIDRTEFDIRYGSSSFFDKLGDKTIFDDFNLSIQLVY